MAGYRPRETDRRRSVSARDRRTHAEDPQGRRHLGCRRRLVPGALALLVRQLPRPGVHAVRLDARVQRRPAGARRHLADASAPRLEGLTYVVEGIVPPPGRRGRRAGTAAGRLGAADDARLRRAAFGAERERDRADAVHPDLDHAGRARPAPGWSRRCSRPRTEPTACSRRSAARAATPSSCIRTRTCSSPSSRPGPR